MKNLLNSLSSWGDGGKGQLPRDRLHPSALARGAACLAAAAGIPGTADACAYEPAQRLLAIATTDGRVKIFGREGVERTLRGSAAGAGGAADPGTQQLLFLANRGALLRVDAAGKVQLWAVDKQEEEIGEDDLRGASEPLHELSPGCDPVTAVAAVPQEPYVLLGCRSGAVRVAMAVDDSGAGVADARQVRRLKLMPYAVTADQLEGFGEVSQLSAARRGDTTLMLCIHSTGGAAVWDLRAQRLLAALEEDESPATSAAWLGDGGPRGDFATGHLNGDVCIWALPPGAGGGGSGNSVVGANGGEASPRRQKLRLGLRLRQKAAEAAAAGAAADGPGAGAAAGDEAAAGAEAAPRARLVSRLRVVPSDADGRAVRAVDYWQSGRTAGLLVWGGGEEEQPEALALLSLPTPPGQGGASDDSPADSGDEKDEGPEAADTAAQPPHDPTDAAAIPTADSPTARARSATPAGAATAAATLPAAGPRRLPWFGAIRGHCLVPAQGAAPASDDAAAVIVLLAGGELCVHDLVRGTSGGGGGGGGGASGGLGAVRGLASGFRARFQAQPPVTAAHLGVVPTEPLPLRGRGGAACMEALREWAGQGGGDDGGVTSPPAGDTGAGGCAWMVDGGRPAKIGATPAPYATLYCTGHEDGGVRLWDLDSHVPLLLGRAPSPAAAAALDGRSHGPAAVCAVEFAWEDGLLLTGHDTGEVRIFQFSGRPRELSAIHFESVGGADANAATPVHETAGFQLLGQVLVHSSPVTSLVYDPSTRTAAAGDAAGTVSLLDLSVPELLWLQAPFRGPVAALSLAPCPLPPARDRSDLLASRLAGAPTGAPLPCVVAVGDDATVGVMDAATGFFLSKEGRLRPKHPSPAVAVEALDSSGSPLWMARDIMALLAISRQQSFAGDADAVAPPAALQSTAANHGSPSALQRRPSAASTSTGGARSRSGSPNRALTAGLAALGLRRTPSAASGAAVATVDTVAAAEGPADGAPRSAAAPAATDAASRMAASGPAAVQEGGATEQPAAAATAHKNVEEEEEGGGVDLSSPFAAAGPAEGDERAAAEGAEGDIDRLLAAAAAHVGDTGGSDALGSAATDGDSASSSSPKGAATAAAAGSAFAPATPPLPSTPPPAAAAAATAAASSPRAVNPPVTLPPDDGSAAYMLVVTEDYLRLYPADGVTRGDRTVTRRVTPQGRVRFAAAFAAQGAPALMVLLDPPSPPAVPPAGDGGSSGAAAAAAGASNVPQPPPQLQVYSLPGLQLVSSMPLAACCGWRCELGGCEASPAAAPSASGASSASGGASSGGGEVRPSAALAATRHGHIAIVAPRCELVRLGLAVGLAPPLPPERVFDWDAAAAAAHATFDHSSSGAAAAAAPATPGAAALRQGPHLAAPGDGDAAAAAAAAGGSGEGEGEGDGAAGEVPATPSAAAGGRAKDFKGFMARIGQDFQKALDETQKGLQKVKQVPGLLSVRSKEAAAAAPQPTLQEVFSTEVPGALLPLESPCASPQAFGGPTAAAGAAAAAAAAAAVPQQGGGVGASGGGGMGRRSWGFPRTGSGGSDATARRELLASSSPATASAAATAGPSSAAAGGGGGARVRTAAEIRAAYGRPSKADAAAAGAAEVGSVMAETMSRLGERGEKLRALEAKGADLAESAAGFAEMAKQLAERERQKAKWFGLG